MSTETKVTPTPGPWEVYDQSLDDGHGYGCHVRSMTDSLSDWIAQDVMNRADARLIAAAPDLLDALKVALGMASSYYNEEIYGTAGAPVELKKIRQMEVAIAKATGDGNG